MGRLIELILILQFTTVVFSQVFIKGSRPYIILPSDSDESPYYDPDPSPPHSTLFQSRSGVPIDESSEKTPGDADESLRNPRFPPRNERANVEEEIEEEEEEQDDDEEVSPDEYETLVQKVGKENVAKMIGDQGRFLWPFHVTISKSKGKHSYHDDWHGWNGWQGWPQDDHHHHHHHEDHGWDEGNGWFNSGNGHEYDKIKLKPESDYMYPKPKIFGDKLRKPNEWILASTTSNPLIEDLKSLSKKELELLNSEAYWKEQREQLRKEYEKSKKAAAIKKKVPANPLEELDMFITNEFKRPMEDDLDYYEELDP